MGCIGSIAAISIGGCLGAGNGTEDTNGDGSGDNTDQDLSDKELLLQSYQEAYDLHVNGHDSTESSLEAIRNDNLTEAKNHAETAAENYKEAKDTYFEPALYEDHKERAKNAFNVDSVDDLPTVHQEAVEAIRLAHNEVFNLSVNLEDNTDAEISTGFPAIVSDNFEQGEYSMPEVSEFEEALP